MLPLCFAHVLRHAPHQASNLLNKAEKKQKSSHKQGRSYNRGTTLLQFNLTVKNLIGFKSLSDITVAPVVPTAGSTHCSQNELHRDITVALHRPAIL